MAWPSDVEVASDGASAPHEPIRIGLPANILRSFYIYTTIYAFI